MNHGLLLSFGKYFVLTDSFENRMHYYYYLSDVKSNIFDTQILIMHPP